MNVDVCFVPMQHEDQGKLPAVSGSSGHLVVERLLSGEERTPWPGQGFAEGEVDYIEVMLQYAQETRDRLIRRKNGALMPEEELTPWRKEWEARAERHKVLQVRRQENADWLVERKTHHRIVDTYRALTRRNRVGIDAVWQAEKTNWAIREAQRQTVLKKRKQENLDWHQDNRIRQDPEKPTMQTWIAILVVTDNCTRQCVALPAFASGSKLTGQEVLTALRECLPKGLAFLISDQGVHFRNKGLAQLAQEADFIHIPIYRHRPQTNGIAERFVLTLKQWMKNRNWNGIEQMKNLLNFFQPYYNDRPHQGLAIPGLSPNEFAKRIWLS